MSDERRSVERRLQDAGNDEADPWPDEPDEFDPESLGPGTPQPPTFSENTETDDETVQAFWGAVILANAGLFAVSIGPMLAYFEGRTTLGAALFVVGIVALGRTYYIYRTQSSGEADDETEPVMEP